MIAIAIKAAVYKQDASSDHAARLERIREMFLDMAAGLEICATDPNAAMTADRQVMEFAYLLGDLGTELEPDTPTP
ncbi:MAG: hypothetical protein R6U98_10020 [Pirellulaceae bacterium]